MKNIVYTIMLVLSFASSFGQQPVFEWAKQTGGTGTDNGTKITLDASGNVYTTGSFQGTVDFDPGTGISTLISNGSSDIFITKFDASGNFIWARQMGGILSDAGVSIDVHTTGEIYVTGVFQDAVDFNPNIGITTLVSAGDSDIFICKFDASCNLIWAKSMGGSNADRPAGIAIDASGNVLTAGVFQGTADFNPGTVVYNLVSAGSNDLFISKLNSSGNFTWGKRIGGADNEEISAIALDPGGNVYTIGHFWGTVDFDPDAGVEEMTSVGAYDIFICKLGSSGSFSKLKQMEGVDYDFGLGLAVDASGNMFATGAFSGTCSFKGSGTVVNLTSSGGWDIFVLKMNASGSLAWAKKMGGTGNDWGSSITLDVANNIYLTGNFKGNCNFNTDASASTGLPSYFLYTGHPDNQNAFVARLTSTGSFTWARQFGSALGDDAGNSIAVDALNNVYTTGNFALNADFDPNANAYFLTSNGASDQFIHKMSQCDTTFLSIVACDAYTWAATGQTYTSSGMYLSSVTCPISLLNLTIHPSPVVTTTTVSGCIGNTIALTGMPTGGTFSIPNPYSGPSTSYYYTFTDSNGCTGVSAPDTIIMDTCTVLNLKFLAEGYYIGMSMMQPVLANEGLSLNTNEVDEVTVELRNGTSPYTLIGTAQAMLQTDGTATCTIQSSIPSGNHYLVIKHRNTVESWSKEPIAITPITTYDFTTAANKAYGDNQIEVESGIWAFYSGDLNADENIDLLDLSIVQNDITNFEFGYIATDLNGDGNVDLLDAPIVEGNVNDFVFSYHP